jgi:hypothetical protein
VVSLLSLSALASTPFDTSGETFQADLYPSPRTAVIRLTQSLAEQVRQQSPDVRAIRIDSDQPGLRDALQHEFPSASIVNDSALSFSATIDQSYVTVSAKGAGIALVASAKFVEKPWADDWTLFRNANSSKRYLKADSRGPATSEAEALASARQAAVEQLLPLIRSTLRANASMVRGDKIVVTDQWLRDRLDYSVKSNASKVLVSDTFVQRFARPYGDVYQASILIDASQPNIQLLNRSYNQAAAAEFGQRAVTFGAAAGLALVIGLLYAFINAVTRGYFMWRLRAAALVVAIASVLIAFAVSS